MSEKFQVVKAKVSDKKQAERDLLRHKENQKLANGLGQFFVLQCQKIKRCKERQ